MSIATKLAELTQIRTDIRTALIGKGISASDHDFADFSTDIASIPSGGGGINWINQCYLNIGNMEESE